LGKKRLCALFEDLCGFGTLRETVHAFADHYSFAEKRSGEGGSYMKAWRPLPWEGLAEAVVI
jgi:hypothetical protein